MKINQSKQNPAQQANNANNDGMDCDNRSDLHVRKAKIKHLCSCSINAKSECVEDLEAITISAQDESVNNLCVSMDLKAKSAGIDTLNANHLCAQEGTINKLCVNELTTSIINNCVKYRAAVTNPSDSTYNLSSSINWTTVVDDPNGNVATSPAFKYTVPTSGYYIISFHLESDALAGVNTITGIPIGLLKVLINGNILRQLQSPFLSFNGAQSANLTSLSLLNAGDVIMMTYDVLVFDQSSGLIPYVGTINIKANGTFPGSSGFGIHYMSSLNCMPGSACVTCPPVVVPCQPMTIVCECNKTGSNDPCSC